MLRDRLSRAALTLALLGLGAGGGLASACVSNGSGPAEPRPPHLSTTEDYLPGEAADVFLPSGSRTQDGRAPLVVLVPGGGWLTADRAGLTPLAEALATGGMVVVDATYRSGVDGVVFPVPVQDVVCAVDFAASRARRAGLTPGPVVLAGHSSGGQVAALAALAAARFRSGCPFPPVLVDGLVGMAGAFDVVTFSEVAEPFFGVPYEDRPDLWRQGDPATWVGERTSGRPLSVLLLHGADDGLVPTSFSTSFGERLRRAGHPVRVVVVAGADHQSIYRPEVVTTTISDWVRALG